MLVESDVEQMYQEKELTPILVILGGSRAFGYDIDKSDYDYFGYHKEPSDSIVHVGNMDGIYLNSRPIESVMNLLENYEKGYLVIYTLINWICLPPIYESTAAHDTRMQVREFMLENSARINTMFECAIKSINSIAVDGTEYNKSSNKWMQSIHLMMMYQYYKDTGVLEHDFYALMNKYQLKLGSITHPSEVILQ